jgi:hypothetical protein
MTDGPYDTHAQYLAQHSDNGLSTGSTIHIHPWETLARHEEDSECANSDISRAMLPTGRLFSRLNQMGPNKMRPEKYVAEFQPILFRKDHEGVELVKILFSTSL